MILEEDHLISILMATYNGEPYIAEQIESLLAQTVQDFTLYIRDDCSTDGTYEIAQAYAHAHPGKIFASRSEENSGSAKHNFMRMMVEYRDDYLMLCDQDDVWLPDKVEKTLKKLQEMERKHGSETPLLAHTDLRVVDEELRVMEPSFIKAMHADYNKTGLNQLLVQNTLTGCTAMYNCALAELLTKEPPYMVMHDWWLMLVVAAFGRIGHSGEQTILYRQHQGNQIGAKNVNTLRYKLNRFLHGEEVKIALRQTYEQAQSFLGIYEEMLSPEQRHLLRQYVQTPTLPKLARWRRVHLLGTLKNGFSRNVAHFLYI